MPVLSQQQNAYAQYKNNKIMGASGPELTLMLYDGAIKFLNIADAAIEKHDIEKAHSNIIKTEKIIEYLNNTLDMKYPVAQDFENMYVYISRRLMDVIVGTLNILLLHLKDCDISELYRSFIEKERKLCGRSR